MLWLITSLIARFMGPTWGPSGADRTQVGTMLAPWTLLSGLSLESRWIQKYISTFREIIDYGCDTSSNDLLVMLRVDWSFEPSPWEVALIYNNVSHWLGVSLESALNAISGMTWNNKLMFWKCWVQWRSELFIYLFTPEQLEVKNWGELRIPFDTHVC